MYPNKLRGSSEDEYAPAQTIKDILNCSRVTLLRLKRAGRIRFKIVNATFHIYHLGDAIALAGRKRR